MRRYAGARFVQRRMYVASQPPHCVPKGNDCTAVGKEFVRYCSRRVVGSPAHAPASPHTRQWSVALTGIAGGAPLRCYSASDDRAPFPRYPRPKTPARPRSTAGFFLPPPESRSANEKAPRVAARRGQVCQVEPLVPRRTGAADKRYKSWPLESARRPLPPPPESRSCNEKAPSLSRWRG